MSQSLRPRWSDDDTEAVRGLAATFFTKEVLPQREVHQAQGHVQWLLCLPTALSETHHLS